MKKSRGQKGFTLIELVTVIALLCILAAISLPNLSGAPVSATTAKVQADLKILDKALSYYQVSTGKKASSLDALVTAGYLSSVPPAPKDGSSLYVDGAIMQIGTGAGCAFFGGGANEYTLATVDGIQRAVLSVGGVNRYVENIHP